MSIALSIKVNGGIVLATDSASITFGRDQNGSMVLMKVYPNTERIFSLVEDLPIGIITWGTGNIGATSVGTIIRDFKELMVDGNEEWAIDPDSYTLNDVAVKFKEFIFDNNYLREYQDWKQKPALGFMIVGFSMGESASEEWKIDIVDGKCSGPFLVRDQNQYGITWNGEIEAINRLYSGFGTGLPVALKECGLDDNKIKEILNTVPKRLTVPMIEPAMPLEAAVELAEFFIETTVRFSQLAPGTSTVSVPVQTAVVTKYNGFQII